MRQNDIKDFCNGITTVHLAQLVRHGSFKPGIVGSSPTVGLFAASGEQG